MDYEKLEKENISLKKDIKSLKDRITELHYKLGGTITSTYGKEVFPSELYHKEVLSKRKRISIVSVQSSVQKSMFLEYLNNREQHMKELENIYVKSLGEVIAKEVLANDRVIITELENEIVINACFLEYK